MGNDLRRLLLWVVCGVAAGVWASPRTLVAVSGDCADPELRRSATRLAAALRRERPGQVVDAGAVLRVLRPGGTRPLPVLLTELEAARGLAYAGPPERALAALEGVRRELDVATPGAATWSALAAALAQEAVVLRQLGRKAEATEALRRVARVDPAYVLDPDAFSPSALRSFEEVTGALAQARKATLDVRSTPGGAALSVDGRPMGTTPALLKLAPGSYRVRLALGEHASFLHTVELTRDDLLEVDLDFEGAVDGRELLCLGPTADAETAPARLLSLGVADVLVVVSRQRAVGSTVSTLAALVAGAEGKGSRRQLGLGPDRLDELAKVLARGSFAAWADETTAAGAAGAAGAVQSAGEAGPAAPPLGTDAAASAQPGGEASRGPRDSARGAPTTASARELVPAPAARPPELPERASSPPGRRGLALGLGAAGGLSLAAGAAVWLSGGRDRDRLTALTQPDGRLVPPDDAGHAEALGLLPRVDGAQLTALGLGAAGVALGLGGVVTWLLFPGEPSAQVSLAVSGGAGQIRLAGAF